MLERRHESIFIPIFYEVKPSDVCYIKGTYAKAFSRHRKRYKVEVLDKWKTALRKVPETSGVVFNPEEIGESSKDIGQIVDDVVNMVLKEVWIKEPVEVAKHPVGLKQAAEVFEKEIKNQHKGNGIVTVGIVGAGGSGKSTLVKHLYNTKHMGFERSYLLSVTSKGDCPSCQRPLIEYLPPKLLSRHHLRIKVPSDECLDGLLGDHLQNVTKVLIILDEVDNSVQRDSLLKLKDKLGDTSMFVITSRKRDLVSKGSGVNVCINIEPLDDTNARQLFCQHAFRQPRPLSELKEDSVQDVLQICEGLPLALEVLGRKFREVEDQSSWDEKRRSLDENLPDDMMKILEPLDPAEKEVFLDVAHFLVGEDRDLVKRVLDGLNSTGWDCLRRLEQKGFVEYEIVAVNFYDESKHGKCPQSEDFYKEQWTRPKRCFKIKMKRLFRNLARQKAREEFGSPRVPLRLPWKDDRPLSPEPNNFSNVRGIRISKWCRKPASEEIRGLKLLVLEESTIPFRTLSGELVWLRWHNIIPNQVLPRLSLQNLRVMELTGVNLANLSVEPGDEPASELRELTVDLQEISHESASSSSSSPTGSFLLCGCRLLFGELKNLVKLVWKNVKGLECPPFDLAALGELRHLDLSGWSELERLPAITSLSRLEYLALKDCSNLATINLQGISTIELLDLEGCGKLEQLPQGVTIQRSLKYLNLVRTGVQCLQKLGELKNLEQLFIGSPNLIILPASMNKLISLTQLTLIECSRLRSISKSIEELRHLEILRILDSGVEILSEGILRTKIKVLDVVNCPIERLKIEGHRQNDLSSLKRLSIRGTKIYEISIPDRHCPNIEIIDLSENAKLQVVEGVPLPSKLIRLDLMNCPMLKKLTCLSNLEQLKFLNVSGCGELNSLDVQGLTSLEDINVAGCSQLQSIQGFRQSSEISIPDRHCPNIVIIYLSENAELQVVEGVPLPGKLIRLNLMNCPMLKKLTCLSNLKQLKFLNVSGCDELNSLDVQGLTSLEDINVAGCSQLQSIQGFRQSQA